MNTGVKDTFSQKNHTPLLRKSPRLEEVMDTSSRSMAASSCAVDLGPGRTHVALLFALNVAEAMPKCFFQRGVFVLSGISSHERCCHLAGQEWKHSQDDVCVLSWSATPFAQKMQFGPTITRKCRADACCQRGACARDWERANGLHSSNKTVLGSSWVQR